MLPGLMQDDFQLNLPYVLSRMRTFPGAGEVVTLGDDAPQRVGHGEVVERVDRLAKALGTLGIKRGDRVGTLAWNSQRHLECYLAIPCVGAVLHTINLRLFPEQIVYVINHAADRVVFVDDTLVPLLERLAPQLTGVEHFVVMGDGPTGELPRAIRYEELLAASDAGTPEYPQIDEREAAALCYTSGTTGNPKGVLYSHRSTTLHSAGTLMSGSLGIATDDRILLVVPMFHVNAWGLPYAAALCGATLVLPGRHLQAEPLAKLIEDERCTVMACVPTIYADLLRYADEHRPNLRTLRAAICGGATMPVALAQAFEERHGVRLLHAWGMTETSPMCTVARAPSGLDSAEEWAIRATQGMPVPFVDLRLVDDDGAEVAWDGQSTGEIEVRGPWIASGYYNEEAPEKFDNGWLRTGDIARVEPAGWVTITDRSKDVIKSGGEWISSVELENELMSHPCVRESAVIAIADERWGERPLACVVVEPGSEVSAEELVEHLRGRVVGWWLPEEFAFVAEVPKTSVGKFDKKVLRAALAEGRLEGRVSLER
ncbi:MAG TPA: long-chain fatty acid--CoA ligase [Solirubrobacteraceae bacterium]|nr:long-chain fatty acid--CoA ligase [Solirubrobacteraceae bacterium]